MATFRQAVADRRDVQISLIKTQFDADDHQGRLRHAADHFIMKHPALGRRLRAFVGNRIAWSGCEQGSVDASYRLYIPVEIRELLAVR
jgi:hypothetical protein